MHTLDVSTLVPGSRLPRAVFTRHGVMLLGADVTLSDSMCRTLASFRGGPLYLADSADDLCAGGVIARTPMLAGPAGIAGFDIDSDARVTLGGVLAVESGETVRTPCLDAVELGSLVGMDARESARIRSQRTRLADDAAADRERTWSRLPLRADRDPQATAPAGAQAPDESGWPAPASLAQWRGARVAAVRKLFARVLTGLPTHASEPTGLIDELIELCARFPSRFTQLAFAPAERPAGATDEFLPDHAYTTAVLCVATASHLTWTRHWVRLAGLTGLLADVGMGLIPAGVRFSVRGLDDVEANRVRRHPAFGVTLLDTMAGLPEEVALGVYQHHERENGSGYPRGLKGPQIADTARLVAVADSFAAAADQRPYKLAKRPHEALREVIASGARGVLHRPTVLALVRAAGLFPVGSFVTLSGGVLARVDGANARRIDRPRVTVLRREAGALRAGATVDLAEYKPGQLRVTGPADSPDA